MASSPNRPVNVAKIMRTALITVLGWLSQGKIPTTALGAAFGWLAQSLILLLHHRYVDCIDVQDERLLLRNNRWRLLWSVLGPLIAASAWCWLIEKGLTTVRPGRKYSGRSESPTLASTACQTRTTLEEIDQLTTKIRSLEQSLEEQLRISQLKYDEDVEALNLEFARAALIIGGRDLCIMARFKNVSEGENCAIYDIDDKSGTIEIKDNDGSDATTEGVFSGFSGIVRQDQGNSEVWRLLRPGFLAFTCGHPVCFLFDGYSGSGKSYTVFNGPEPIVEAITIALFDWKQRIHLLNGSVILTFEANIVERHQGSMPTQDHPHIRTPDELREAIQSVRRARDKKNRTTNNNISSSRSHLVMRFAAVWSNRSGRTPSKVRSSLCLVDLAGNERTEDPQGRKVSDEELSERNFINTTRNELAGMLKDPSNMSYKGALTKHLRHHIFIPSGNEREPKVFIFSLLGHTVASRQNTINTLNFTQELIEARGGGKAAAAGRPRAGGSKQQAAKPAPSGAAIKR